MLKYTVKIVNTDRTIYVEYLGDKRIRYLRHNRQHRIGKPAIIWDDGSAEFYQYGKPIC